MWQVPYWFWCMVKAGESVRRRRRPRWFHVMSLAFFIGVTLIILAALIFLPHPH